MCVLRRGPGDRLCFSGGSSRPDLSSPQLPVESGQQVQCTWLEERRSVRLSRRGSPEPRGLRARCASARRFLCRLQALSQAQCRRTCRHFLPARTSLSQMLRCGQKYLHDGHRSPVPTAQRVGLPHPPLLTLAPPQTPQVSRRPCHLLQEAWPTPLLTVPRPQAPGPTPVPCEAPSWSDPPVGPKVPDGTSEQGLPQTGAQPETRMEGERVSA